MTAFAAPTLRPLSMGQLLDRAIRLYRQNFLTFVGIVAIPQIPITLMAILVNWFNVSTIESTFQPGVSDLTQVFSQSFGLGTVIAIVSAVLNQVARAAMTRAVADNYLGKSVSILGAYQHIGSAWLSLVGALLLSFLVGVALGVWFIIPCIGWFTGGGMLLFFAMVVTPLVAPVIVLEKQLAKNAISRAWDLARRRFWWLLGFTLLLGLFAQLVVTGPALLATFLVQSVTGISFGDITATIIQQIITLIFNLIYLPLPLTCFTLVYFDLRVRTEGFDLVLQTADAADMKKDLIAQSAHETGFTSQAMPTSTELGNFAIISIAGLVLYLGLVFLVILLGISLTGLSGF